MHLGNTRITLEENEERLKVVMPLERHQLAALIYTVLFIVWLGALILFIYWLFNPPQARGISDLPPIFRLIWIVGVLIWLYVWVRTLGRSILRWWQYHLATRELLFIDKNTYIVRRPVSIFGITDAYDRRYVAPFYHSETHNALAFQYGETRHILFGQTLRPAEQSTLLDFLNQRYFPHFDDDEDDE